jgi:hypothetical protein
MLMKQLNKPVEHEGSTDGMLMKQKNTKATDDGGGVGSRHLLLEVFDGETPGAVHQVMNRGHWALPPSRARSHGLRHRCAQDGTGLPEIHRFKVQLTSIANKHIKHIGKGNLIRPVTKL